CAEKTVSIGDPPPSPEFSIDKIDENNIVFSVTSAEGFMVNWDFGNGSLSQKEIDTMYYPFADSYTVKLTVSNRGGATTTRETVVIEETDPAICANQYYTYISGGCDVESKTWKIADADSALANGPPAPKDANGNGISSYNDPVSFWWKSSKETDPPVPPSGALDDEYVFGLRGFTYKNDCNGDFYFNWQWCNKLFGTQQNTYKDTVHAYIPNNPATWVLDVDTTTPEDTILGGTVVRQRFFTDSATGKRFNLILTLSNDNYLGYCSGTSIYQILKITPDTMYLRHELVETDPKNASATGANRLEWRYLRLVTKE
ncbi:MAG: PKD domain-containing protein, partial [Chitinispirillaceae bacterium]|nr:PKD domain-containing protein [Chitinispirillaceae bacterium]